MTGSLFFGLGDPGLLSSEGLQKIKEGELPVEDLKTAFSVRGPQKGLHFRENLKKIFVEKTPNITSVSGSPKQDFCLKNTSNGSSLCTAP